MIDHEEVRRRYARAKEVLDFAAKDLLEVARTGADAKYALADYAYACREYEEAKREVEALSG
jgi:hypothetical protein